MYNSFGKECKPQPKTGLLRVRNKSNVCVVKKGCRSPTRRELIDYTKKEGIRIELGKRLKDGPKRVKKILPTGTSK